MQIKTGRTGLLRPFTGIAHGLAAQGDSAVDCPDDTGRHTPDFRIFALLQPVEGQHRRGEHASQVVIDLGHAFTQRRQAVFLVQGISQRRLHDRQFTLRDTNFITALARLDGHIRVLRIGPELFHGGRDPAHGPDHHQLQAEINQPGREQGNHD